MSTQQIAEIPADHWEPLVDLLREELQEYGGFLALLRDQQKAILHHDAEFLTELEEEIEEQVILNQKLRNRRVTLVAEIAEMLGANPECNLKELLPGFPEAAQPMIEALIDEINSIIDRARNNLRQNQMLLSRASQVTEKILGALNPRPSTKVYTRAGNVAVKSNGLGSFMHTSA